jgi:diaminopimelate decarboxylase
MSAPFDFFEFKKGSLTTEGVSLSKIADTTGTPVYVYSANAFLNPLRELQKGLKGIDHLICFAVKSNSNIALLRMLSEAGAGMDLVSGGELFRALKAGVPSNRIVFSGVGKTPGEMLIALEEGIYSFNVESTAELEALSSVAMEIGTEARVALRFNPDVDAKTHPYISTGLKKNKFGLQRSEILTIIKNENQYPGIKIEGISIHIGSQILSLQPLKDAFTRLRSLMDELETKFKKRLGFVDLGGGVGITYKNEKSPSLNDYTQLIQKYFGPRSSLSYPIRILVEPGRILAGNAGVLLTEVLYRKKRGTKDFLVVDAGMNDLMRPSLYGSYHEIVPVQKGKVHGQSMKYDVVGPVCESSDCFASDRKLSRDLKSGDLLAILSAGAYGASMSSNYNTRPRPPEVLVRNGKFRLIRERESYEDLISREIIE